MSTTDMTTIPHHRAFVAENQLAYVTAAMHGKWSSGYGPFGERAAALLREITGAAHVLLTTSATTALDLSTLLLDVGPGDEVIVPSYTFVSTASVWVQRGAVPVFADCRPDTLNIDEDLIEAAVTARTRAVVVTHYAGVACEMDKITKIAERHGLALVEDNAHGLGGTYRDRPLGTFGRLAALSFHATKNVQCGEGGALLAAGDDLARRAEIIRDKGTNRRQFFRGEVDRYRWVDVGTNYMQAEPLAAQLVAQLEAFGEIQRRRQEVWRAYHDGLAAWARDNGVARPAVPPECVHPAHIYYLLLPHAAGRTALIAHLAERGVQAVFHYSPLHASPAGEKYGRAAPGGCPVAESVADRQVRLPLYPGLDDGELGRVLDSVTSFKVS
ncbi:dTDP-4-amino-4,6-dideoxygalactose transaminase [Sphaerisporangium krabiense]|uniref:dTDP-4-amino-4,6-dideoxygalactose transaminase n=1 Tax=Sphaerisporangium krabiense TaxID=763782 RepID=A0A7W8ZAR5_9ACTN|nr:dTDP-4-amino-4,6-dideoxygalactose transaminase [Sphaerisporangium krabiense]MBB5630571.1 dTDP-4-amino-4,6-dideoxygalactose transaminase [Sphaerisporangium krabiense]